MRKSLFILIMLLIVSQLSFSMSCLFRGYRKIGNEVYYSDIDKKEDGIYLFVKIINKKTSVVPFVIYSYIFEITYQYFKRIFTFKFSIDEALDIFGILRSLSRKGVQSLPLDIMQ